MYSRIGLRKGHNPYIESALVCESATNDFNQRAGAYPLEDVLTRASEALTEPEAPRPDTATLLQSSETANQLVDIRAVLGSFIVKASQLLRHPFDRP